MKLCPKCNYSNQDFDTVCVNCGSQLENNNDYNSYVTNPPMPAKTNGFAIASLILGICSIVLCCCYLGIITGPLAVVFGFIAKNKIRNSGGTEKGEGLALAGIITGFVGVAIFALIIISILLGAGGNLFNREYWQQYLENASQNGGGSTDFDWD